MKTNADATSVMGHSNTSEEQQLEYHEKLVASEHARASQFADSLEYYDMTSGALNIALSSAIAETNQVYDYIKQLSVVHETFNNNLKIPVSSLEDLEQEAELEDQETVVSSVAQTSISAKEDDSISYHGNLQPPVQFISFPNPQGSNPALYELTKLHDTLRFNTIDQVSKVYSYLETLKFHRDELLEHQIVSILTDLRTCEGSTQKTFEDYLATKEAKPVKQSALWLAELQYKQAVQQQEELLQNQQRILVNLISRVQDYEVERNSELPRIMSEIMTAIQTVCTNMVQSHATSLEALSTHTPHQYSIEARIQQVADFTGTTAILHYPPVPNHQEEHRHRERDEHEHKEEKVHEEEKEMEAEKPERRDREHKEESNVHEEEKQEVKKPEHVVVDVDDTIDCSTDEDLPLLADAKPLKKQHHHHHHHKKKKRYFVPKVKNVVVLDPSSTKHAYFIDRFLYTGSLLESHFVHWAAVAGVESSNRTALVVLTVDRMLHVLDVTGSDLKAGSSPEAALQYFVQNFEETERKQRQEPLQSSNEKRGTNPFEESKENLVLPECRPTVSMKLAECVVRITRRGGENAVKISSNHKQYAAYSKLNFATNDDQLALIEACRGRDSMLQI